MCWSLQPDVIIVATGGTPDIEWINGAEHVTSAWDVIGVPFRWALTS